MSDTFFCLLPGIQFWETDHPGWLGPGIATLTLGARELDVLAGPLPVVLEPLGSAVRWHSLGYRVWPNRLHAIRAAKQMARTCPVTPERRSATSTAS